MSDETRLDRLLRWFKNNRAFSILMLLALAIVGTSQLVGALTSLIATGRSWRAGTAAEVSTTITGPLTVPAPATAGSDITVVAEFGSKGTGPGYFNDARFLAIDRGRELIVAEYGGRGRVQRLSLAGQPIAQWFLAAAVAEDYHPAGIVDDQAGDLYVGRFGALIKIDVATGRVLAQADLGGCDPWVDGVGLQSAGAIAICSENFAMYRYDRPDRPIAIRLPQRPNTVQVASRLAVDGDDAIYVLDPGNSCVYKLAADGTFQTRFGGEAGPGGGHGLLDGPSTIAVDGAGDVYVADFDGLQVFASDGRFLRTLTMPNTAIKPFDMVFDRKHDLYAVYGDKVRVLRVPAAAGA